MTNYTPSTLQTEYVLRALVRAARPALEQAISPGVITDLMTVTRELGERFEIPRRPRVMVWRFQLRGLTLTLYERQARYIPSLQRCGLERSLFAEVGGNLVANVKLEAGIHPVNQPECVFVPGEWISVALANLPAAFEHKQECGSAWQNSRRSKLANQLQLVLNI